MNEHLIWVFREIVVLLNNLEEGRNVDTISDCMINNELDQMNLYFLFSFKSFKQLIFLCSNNATGYIIELISYFFASESTEKVRRSLNVELVLYGPYISGNRK